MYTSIFQNSYVIFAISFIVLTAIFYIFEIGFTTKLENGKIVKKFSWTYPLVLSLIIWLFWHFYLYPPKEEITANYTTNTQVNDKYFTPSNRMLSQKINMNNWT